MGVITWKMKKLQKKSALSVNTQSTYAIIAMEVKNMKLGSDCIRDILITMEKLSFDGELRIEELCEALPKYEAEEVHYTAL